MEPSIAAALTLGFVHGLRHALDPDHLVAVSTIVSEQKNLSRSSLVGTFWGLGHSSALFAIGLAIILLRASIPEPILLWLEMPVALMLIVLGLGSIRRTLKKRGVHIHTHVHEHDREAPHAHIHLHYGDEHDHKHRVLKLGGKPFAVGLVHGIAGSAALTLLALTTMPSVALGLLYIAVFGIGSIGGMLLMSVVIGLPFVISARRFSAINSTIRLCAGLFSVLFGLMLAWAVLRDVWTVS